MSTVRKPLQLLSDGEITFEKFAKSTDVSWTSLARKIVSKWPGSSAVDTDDVKQELLLAVWQTLPKWDRKLGPVDSFVIFTAMSIAKRWHHKQRGASTSGNADKNPSRFDVLTFDDVEDRCEEVQAVQERIVEMLRRVNVACKMLSTEEERASVAAFCATGSFDSAMQLIADSGLKVSRRMMTKSVTNVVSQLEL